MDEIMDPALVARRRAAAEQLVRDQVLADTFVNLPAPTARQHLEASHYQLISGASPLAIGAAGAANRITPAHLAQAAGHRTRFGA